MRERRTENGYTIDRWSGDDARDREEDTYLANRAGAAGRSARYSRKNASSTGRATATQRRVGTLEGNHSHGHLHMGFGRRANDRDLGTVALDMELAAEVTEEA